MTENLPDQPVTQVLIVDDSPSDRAIYRRFLMQSATRSYAVREAETINQALSEILKERPDCVLLDYDLPDGSGLNLIDRTTDIYGENSIPIVMLSGVGGIETALETIQRGAQDFLVKTRATAFDLVWAINNAIERVGFFQKQKTAAEKVRLSEERYRVLFNSIDEGFCIIELIFDERQKAVDYKLLEVNQAFEKQTGFQNAEGKRISEFIPNLEVFWLETYGNVAKTGVPVRVDNRVEGLNQWVEVYAFRVGSEKDRQVGIIFNDISERRLAEEKIRESEQKLATLAETVPQLVWMANPDGHIFWYNRNWYDYTGTAPAEMEGWGWQTVHDPKMLDQVVVGWRKSIETGAPFEMEFPLRGRDEKFRWFLTRVNPQRDENGRITGWFGTNTDIEDIRQMRLRAEEANRMKDEFLATLSHELRTPLNAILGWSQLIQSQRFGESELKKALTIIDRNARSQNQLIEDILDVSRIITGKFRLDVRALDLMPVITAAVETIRPAAEAKNIRLQTLLDPQAANLSGDPERLQQVIWNLLSNAVKFTPKNGRVQVRLERVNSHVEIVVSDTGKGIEAEFLPFVFDRFRQSDGSMARRHGGLGLGLSIVRQIVELHGGTVSVESPGKEQGTMFLVNLPLLPLRVEPLAEEPRVHPEAEENQRSNAVKAELDNLQILVVDDELDSRELLKIALESEGAKVVAASNAAEAFEKIQTGEFDVLVSDIGMPNENGFSLIGRIRKLSKAAGGATPAIALTAYARTEDRIQSLQSGFQMHVSKPIQLEELIVIILNIVKKK